MFNYPLENLILDIIIKSLNLLEDKVFREIIKKIVNGEDPVSISKKYGIPMEIINFYKDDLLCNFKKLIKNDLESRSDDRPRGMKLTISNINRDIISKLKQNPEFLYQLSPRKFEEIVADLLADMGFINIQLTSFC